MASADGHDIGGTQNADPTARDAFHMMRLHIGGAVAAVKAELSEVYPQLPPECPPWERRKAMDWGSVMKSLNLQGKMVDATGIEPVTPSV